MVIRIVQLKVQEIELAHTIVDKYYFYRVQDKSSYVAVKPKKTAQLNAESNYGFLKKVFRSIILAGINLLVRQSCSSATSFLFTRTNPQRVGLSDYTTCQVKQFTQQSVTVLHMNNLILLFNYYIVREISWIKFLKTKVLQS